MSHKRHEKHENKGKGLVPRLRFPEFRDAGEWQERPLSKFIDRLEAGVSVNSSDRPATVHEKGILKTSAVTDGIFDPMENKVVADAGEKCRLKEPVVKNTIIISRMNTPALVGANAYIKEDYENLFLPDRLWAAKPKADTSMQFIAYILGSGKGRAALSELATGTSGSMKNIAKANVLELPVVTPGPKEQQKIADCLSSLDVLIAAHTEKLDALKTHKKGLMQRLFPREGETVPCLRFPEFRDTGEWTTHKLAEIAEFHKGKGISKADIKPNGKQPCIRYGELYTIYGELIENVISKTDLSLDNLFLSNVGDVIIPSSGETKVDIATAACVAHKNIALGSDLNVIRSNQNGVFLSYYLNGPLKLEIAKVAQGDTVVHLYKSNLEKLGLAVPLPEEQLKIADFLSSLDALIVEHTEKFDALKTHKKGLMQHVFPNPEAVGA